ncbi:hypothetical protein AAZX31_08G236900 [Glycine max]|uniref:Calmodulin-binding domain-containing protein n=2 Tax=Glycine subgen. Soja TaxID=1462606 RepID=I1KWC0_SOYBN|nr:uncharacterized protein LOC100784819 [Glycine max]XP_028247314.1 uncharacterized protein LOC114424652 [Glycine soja]XP_028247315.1 uncharacterized protein LOC114424652 [Glycine soja]KAG5026394.1 hypothetical protein JHK86_022308 [Glycine max]KAG5137552.1 hypothetical protein JHK82_022283 [Glycine max]KAH1052867.1 hypothetical protein GYH30_022242 [Glycine max]KAH1238405.1 hypothetical protein GmHk_08G023072 [Glycine max]KHM98803.1 hypothetical protein glysoja_022213 [Glycine soja]|eukprot:XP_006585763.1 uncharacterized protein LOC100784819 [Glycine max]
MAKESVDLPLIPKVTMSSGVALRRHSAGIANSGNNEKKLVPHYLRASTGSCHDFCKYGRKNVEEAREKLSIIKRAGRKSLSRSSEDIIDGIMTSVAKQKTSLDSTSTKMSTVKHSESVGTNKMELPTKSSGSQKQMGNKVLVNTSKASLVSVKPSFLPKSHISSIPEARRGGISLSFEVEALSKPTSKRVEASPTETSERVKTHPKSTSQIVKTSPKSMFKKKQTLKVSPFEEKEMELSDKHVTSLNPDFITKQTISSVNSSDVFGGQRNSKIKMNKKEVSSKSSSRGIGSVSARKHKGLKIVPHLMNQPKPIKVELEEHNNEAQEKTLYIIKMESTKQSSHSDQNESQDIEDQEESEYSNSEFEEDACPENHEIEYMANVDTLEVEKNGKPQNDEIVCSEEKECQQLGGKLVETQIEYMANVDTFEAEKNGKPQKDGIVCSEDKECHKLRGELVETQIEYMANVDTLEAEENGKPQKHGINCSEAKECQKLGGELLETHIEKGSLRSLEVQKEVLGAITTDVKAVAITAPEKVLLRHQHVQVKKDGQGLYNNVIKETTKHVETQKGKVKALIDAFEAVISLEEKSISAANIVN